MAIISVKEVQLAMSVETVVLDSEEFDVPFSVLLFGCCSPRRLRTLLLLLLLLLLLPVAASVLFSVVLGTLISSPPAAITTASAFTVGRLASCWLLDCADWSIGAVGSSTCLFFLLLLLLDVIVLMLSPLK